MIISKRNKLKLLTVPSKKVSSNLFKANSLNSHQSPAEFFNETHSEDALSPSNILKKRSISKKIHILQEMGFGSLINSKVDSGTSIDQSSRKFSIGISDFWTGKSRQKFLREQGYREAFDSLKKKELISDLNRVSSLRRPSLPHVMDSNIRKRSVVVRQSFIGNTEKVRPAKSICFSSRNAEKINEGIDFMIDKCDDFVKDSLKLKAFSQKIVKDLKNCTESREKIKRKVTRHEKNMIAAIAYSMAS
jgi:hypothetical protein